MSGTLIASTVSLQLLQVQTTSARKFVWDEANYQLHIAKVIVQCTSIVSIVANEPGIVSTLKR